MTSQDEGIFTALLYVMVEEIRCWGSSSQSACESALRCHQPSSACSGGLGFFNEASARHPPKTAAAAAPSHIPEELNEAIGGNSI
jgi:hypothetical protein